MQMDNHKETYPTKKSSINTMQETKCNHFGQLNLEGCYTYEHLRSKKEGGGVAISVLIGERKLLVFSSSYISIFAPK